ncbi:MAG TPA: L,D-transpeptidase family protein [Candidatus Acidoferrales bacterium]|nr:L,D-transpeptidase family protein [Candidatus Acidoferrales bacterium]
MTIRWGRQANQRGWVLPPAAAFGSILVLAGLLVPAAVTPPAALLEAQEELVQTQAQFARLSEENERLSAALAEPDPNEIYLIVDTQSQRLYVFRGSTLLCEAVVSTGSGKVLTVPAEKRWWVFETPRGVRRVQKKIKNPVWFKPDWAFIEEGLPVPPPRDPSRVVRGILGAYALDLGDSYKIHGTKEKDRLGEPVSHGCVRVGDEDLEFVYENAAEGTRVFLY